MHVSLLSFLFRYGNIGSGQLHNRSCSKRNEVSTPRFAQRRMARFTHINGYMTACI